jgi:Arc/MetJ-type ribon-helix-helix transcriptional regulator
MKLSVSLSDEDVEFLDAYAEEQGYASRSAVVQRAVGLLRADDLADEYEAAWETWPADGVGWDAAVGDGLDADAPR